MVHRAGPRWIADTDGLAGATTASGVAGSGPPGRAPPSPSSSISGAANATHASSHTHTIDRSHPEALLVSRDALQHRLEARFVQDVVGGGQRALDEIGQAA